MRYNKVETGFFRLKNKIHYFEWYIFVHLCGSLTDRNSLKKIFSKKFTNLLR